MSITNFTATFDLFASSDDGSDDDVDADIIPLIGTVTFTPQLRDNKPFLASDFSPRKAGLRIRPFTGYIDTDGQLKASAGGPVGVRLWANDPVLNVEHLYYAVKFNVSTQAGQKVRVDGGLFEAPSEDVDVDLTDVLTPTGTSASAIKGDKGDAATIEIGEVTSTSSTPSVTNSGTENFAVLDFELPKGDSGTIEIGTVTASAPGSSPSITNVGPDASTAVLNFVLPRGETGDRGPQGIPGDSAVASDVFNWRDDNTRKVQRSIAKARAGLAAHHLFVGDSITSGVVGQGHLRCWSYVARTQLNLRGIPLGGTGWVPTGYNADGGIDARFTKTGTWAEDSAQGWSQKTSSAGATLTFVSEMPGTTVQVAYADASGPFTVSIDGQVIAVTPAVQSPTPAVQVSTFSGLAPTTHTVTITATSGTVTIHAVNVSMATGLQFHNVALSRSTAADWATAAASSRPWQVARLGITPDVVHIALGINDVRVETAGSPASAATAVGTVRAAWPDADVILYAQSQQQGITNWPAYVELLYDLAESIDCPLVDVGRRFGGSYTAAAANGLMTDTAHPNSTGQALWGLHVAHLLMGKV